jgi:hypothetical protein
MSERPESGSPAARPGLAGAWLGNLAVLLAALGLCGLAGELVLRCAAPDTVHFPRYHAEALYGEFALRRLRPSTRFVHRGAAPRGPGSSSPTHRGFGTLRYLLPDGGRSPENVSHSPDSRGEVPNDVHASSMVVVRQLDLADLPGALPIQCRWLTCLAAGEGIGISAVKGTLLIIHFLDANIWRRTRARLCLSSWSRLFSAVVRVASVVLPILI